MGGMLLVLYTTTFTSLLFFSKWFLIAHWAVGVKNDVWVCTLGFNSDSLALLPLYRVRENESQIFSKKLFIAILC